MVATAENTEGDIPPGTVVLGRYQVLGKLAQGGMAEVYLARQVGPGGYQKLVVTKRVRPHLSKDDDFVGMFVNEARLAAMINHPNVVQIFDLGDEPSADPAGSGTDWFLAMEYLDGRDMLQVGRACRSHNKAVPFDVTARIIADACGGLEHAHNLRGADGKTLDLVHRDMSPENIIITFEGQVKVVDFGIAKAADNSIRTQAGQIKGKLGYVAPEAILGKPVDARADIFAVGATLYLFLSGRPAFTGTSPMEIFERSLKAPPSPAEVNPRVPPVLDEICMKALAQDRDKRYRTAGEVRAALDAYLSSTGRPLAAPQLSQFMRILFPPDKDPVRQRIDKLVADAQAFPPPPRRGPRTGPTDDNRTAVAPRAVEIGPSGPSGPTTHTEIPPPVASTLPGQRPVGVSAARVAPAHLRSVGVAADIPDVSSPGLSPPSAEGDGDLDGDGDDKTVLTGRMPLARPHNTAESVDLVRTMDIEAVDSGLRAALDDSTGTMDIEVAADDFEAVESDLDGLAEAVDDPSDVQTVQSHAVRLASDRSDDLVPTGSGAFARVPTGARMPETGLPQGTELPPPFEVSGSLPRPTESLEGAPVGFDELASGLAPVSVASVSPRSDGPVPLGLRFAMAALGIATGSVILFIALALAGQLPIILGG